MLTIKLSYIVCENHSNWNKMLKLHYDIAMQPFYGKNV